MTDPLHMKSKAGNLQQATKHDYRNLPSLNNDQFLTRTLKPLRPKKDEILIQENHDSPSERYPNKRAWGSPERESKFKANFSKLDAKLGYDKKEER